MVPGDPVLARMEDRLKAVLQRANPRATLGYEEGRLVARSQTLTFQVHALGRMKSSPVMHYNPRPYPEVGPDYGGFYLEVFTEDDPPQLAMAGAGMEEREAYWTRYTICYPVQSPGRAPYLWAILKYNEGTDRRLVAQLKKIVASPG